MGKQWRHFSALFRKNTINWKRTPVGSAMEVLCPVALMLLLVYLRTVILPTKIDSYSLYSLRHPIYPIAMPAQAGNLTGNFTVNPINQLAQAAQLQDFMAYADYLNVNTTLQIPVGNLFDVAGLEKSDERIEIFLDNSTEAIEEARQNLTRLLTEVPIKNLTRIVEWDRIDDFFDRSGLNQFIQIDQAIELVENVENLFENPEQTVAEIANLNVTDLLNQLSILELEELEIEVPVATYIPMIDPLGAYLFYPDNCYGNKKRQRFSSPVIAYVRTGSSVEDAVISQIDSLFEFQRNINQEGNTAANALEVLSDLISVGGVRVEEFDQFGSLAQGAAGGTGGASLRTFGGGLQNFLQDVGDFQLTEFETDQALFDYFEHPDMGRSPDRPAVCYGFKIKENDKGNKFELELFFNDQRHELYNSIPDQKKRPYRATSYLPNLSQFRDWNFRGFMYMQNWVANTILKMKTGNANAQIAAFAVPQRMPDLVKDDFIFVLQGVLTFFILVMYIPPLYRTCYRIVQEKESRVKESMKMMGLKDLPYWGSWLAYYTIVNTVLSTLSWLILTYWVIVKTQGWVLFAGLWLYGQSLFGLLLIVQSGFDRARTAAVTCSVGYFGTTMFYNFVRDEIVATELKALACLSPTVAMIQTFRVLAQFEVASVGVSTDNLFSYSENFSVGIGLIMLAIDALLWPLIGYYLELVLPKSFGSRRHPLFFLMPSFWGGLCCSRNRQVKPQQGQNRRGDLDNTSAENDASNGDANEIVTETTQFETQFLNKDCYEKVHPHEAQKELEKKILKIAGLEKTYENGFQAVKGINLKMFSDQIFVLLGHNGAGKTSTISMLTGLYEPSGGKAEVFGKSINEDLDEVRQCMGVCPQHDVLFDLLTPEEHLDIFYEFKGGDKNVKKDQIEKLLVDIGVADKRKAMAFQLSGGNKRKLSVAIALCAQSKFVLLDEPTSGMDLSARRQLWNTLKDYKKGRIMLLTTHYMDEADILGDRIGIMTGGKLTCLGSSLFLKNRFGVGYVMTIVKNENGRGDKILAFLKAHLGEDVSKLTEIQSETMMQIPKGYTDKFRDFFTIFDESLQDLGIVSYGMSVTTLEQVFLEIGHLDDPSQLIKEQRISQQTSNVARSFYSSHKMNKRQNSLPILESANKHSDDSEFLQIEPQDKMLNRSIDFHSKAAGTGLYNEKGGFTNEIKPLSIEGVSVHEKDIESGQKALAIKKKVFSVQDSTLNTSFGYHLGAQLYKRVNNFRRNKRQLFNEIVLPAAFVIFGVWVAQLSVTYQSPSKILSPLEWQNPQKTLVNSLVVDQEASNLSPKDLIKNLPFSDQAFDVTYFDNRDQSDTFDEYSEQVFKFGRSEAGQEPYHYSSYEIFRADSENHQYQFLNYLNLTSRYAPGYFPQFMYESILKTATNDTEFEFKTRSSGLPVMHEIWYRIKTSDSGTIIFFSSIAFSILITVTISYVVVERESMLKHIQMISGMRLSAYWTANFLFDTLKFYVTIAVSVMTFFIFGFNYFDSVIIVLAIFPFGILPFTYVMSFLFTVDSAAQTFTLFLHFFVMLVASTLIFALRIVFDFEWLGDILSWAFKAIPSFCVSMALYFEASGKEIAKFRNTTEGTGMDLKANEWHWQNNTGDMIILGFHFVFWFLILFLIEIDLGKRLRACYHCCIRLRFPRALTNQEIKFDEDVLDEEERIKEMANEDLKIKVEGLRKVYMTGKGPCTPGKPLLAVERISFGLESGECFALLGVNGAGKSTTFKSLTCEVEPTDGQIHIGALDIRRNFNKVKKLIGYCPQQNLIFDTMSVVEHIDYYARIKGIPYQHRSQLVEQAIVQLDLDKHRDKLAGNLSGGNKRKLCVAMAIVGNPPIILLDEPSAGMDPEARRFMWRVVSQIASDKTSAVILTTHSMEEAEALSTKMGIMVKGGIFKCFGSSQHIKDKFGKGFIIELKASMPNKIDCESIARKDLQMAQNLTVRDTLRGDLSRILKRSSLQDEAVQILINQIQKNSQSKTDKDNNSSRVKQIKAVRFQQNEANEVSYGELAQIFSVQRSFFGIMTEMAKTFGKVDVVESYGNYIRLRVDRGEKTIGSLFKLVEELKSVYKLQDYSVSQTNLEQIFQGFADLNFDESMLSYTVDPISNKLVKHEEPI